MKQTYLIPIFQSLKMQLYFINDILDFSQLLANKPLPLKLIKFSAQQLVQDLSEVYSTTFQQKKLLLSFEVTEEVRKRVS